MIWVAVPEDKGGSIVLSMWSAPRLSPIKVMSWMPSRVASLVAASKAYSSAICWLAILFGAMKARAPHDGKKIPIWKPCGPCAASTQTSMLSHGEGGMSRARQVEKAVMVRSAKARCIFLWARFKNLEDHLVRYQDLKSVVAPRCGAVAHK